ncbi:MAG: flagellin [Rhodospirillaceae bacterium]|nr:flagellin [Rhodospirillaceae bacterium]
MVGVIYNQASAIANRTLQNTSEAATNSLQKLASGKRVVTAKDDVSSMAIGSRLQLASKALKVLTNNVTQGLSVTSIAEGGITRVQEMLGRMQELAAQAGSDNLGATERGFLNSEFQAMKAEITRTTASTRFNGSTLINGNQSIDANGASLIAAAGFVDIAYGNLSNANLGTLNGTVSYQSNGATGAGVFGISFNQGQSLSGSIDPTILDGSTRAATGFSVRLSAGASPNSLNGADSFVILNLNTNLAINNSFGGGSYSVDFGSQTNQTNLAFKIGDGGQAYNAINSYIQGVNLAALGLTNADITTKQGSDGASDAIKNALDVLVTSRTSVGAVQSRLQVAGENQKVMLENIDASVSAYLDVDISTEMTKLTSLQVLQQIGVAMASQANNNTRDMVRLFQ